MGLLIVGPKQKDNVRLLELVESGTMKPIIDTESGKGQPLRRKRRLARDVMQEREELVELSGLCIGVVQLARASKPNFAHCLETGRRSSDSLLQSIGELLGIPSWHEPATRAVFDELGNPSEVARDDRATQCECLHDDDWEPLGKAWDDQCSGFQDVLAHCVVVDPSSDADLGLQAESHDKGFYFAALRSVSGEGEFCIYATLGEQVHGAYEHRGTLFSANATNANYGWPIGDWRYLLAKVVRFEPTANDVDFLPFVRTGRPPIHLAASKRRDSGNKLGLANLRAER
jgi:hypothetical protein